MRLRVEVARARECVRVEVVRGAGEPDTMQYTSAK